MNIIQSNNLVSKLAAELDEALRLLQEAEHTIGVKQISKAPFLPLNLLDQCLALCQEHYAISPEPIRTIHHFACTGGTLICKCIASMPNVQLLSEVDPLSTIKFPSGNSSGKSQFTPTDIVTLLRESTRGTSEELLVDLFLNNLEVIYLNTSKSGLRLVLRDHAHSHYCGGGDITGRPNLLSMITRKFLTLSIVTVRDPIDSYLSLQANKWIHFSPQTFEEYCMRYNAFVRSYEEYPLLRYEDFIDDPSSEMMKICNLLDLPFNPDFADLFAVNTLSGDSGRSGDIISKRSRRSVDSTIIEEMKSLTQYKDLRSLLGYE